MPAPQLRITTPTPPAADPIQSWLDTLSLLLRLPPADRQNVRDELEEHLRERVRDLLITGEPEATAATRALAELGDAAKLADRLMAASRPPRRRTLMNLAVVGIAAAALATSLMTFNAMPASQPGAQGQPTAGIQFSVPLGPTPPKDLTLTLHPGMLWSEFTKQVQDHAGMQVLVRSKLLEQHGIQGDSAIDLDAPIDHLNLNDALSLINETFKLSSDNGAAFRIQNNRLVIAPQQYFDEQEMTLTAYDLAEPIRERANLIVNSTPIPPNTIRASDETIKATETVTSEVRKVIQEMVHSELWRDNGGDRGSISVYSTKLFIKAPKRIQPEIDWLLAQLPIKHDDLQPAGIDQPRGFVPAEKIDKPVETLDLNLKPRKAVQVPALSDIPLTETRQVIEVPVLSDIPIISSLFTTRAADGKVDAITIRSADGQGDIELTGPAGTIRAKELQLVPKK